MLQIQISECGFLRTLRNWILPDEEENPSVGLSDQDIADLIQIMPTDWTSTEKQKFQAIIVKLKKGNSENEFATGVVRKIFN